MKFPTTTATVHTLKNGLTVILDSDGSAPVISSQIWVETGSIHEGEFLGAGVSHLLEHMVFKGTENYIDGPSEGTDTFLSVLLDMVFKPTFPEGEFEKEKDVIRREIDMGLDDPDSMASRLMFETAFMDDHRNQPVIGHLELFNRITREDMCAYHKARYTTENAFLVLTGDFDKVKMLKKLEELNTTIERSFTVPVTVASEPEQQGLREAESKFAIPASKYSLSWQGPPMEHPDAVVLDLATTLLGGGKSSRLYQQLREKKQLCLHVGAWGYMPTKAPGLISISAELEAKNIEAFERAVHEEIMHLLSDALDKELAKAKRMTLSTQLKTLTTASGKASDLASNWHEARNLNFTRDYLEKIDAVSISDIRRVVEKWMTSEKTLTRLVIHPNEHEDLTSNESSNSASKNTIVERQLKNGLRLKMRANAKVPLVSIHVAVKAGLLSETSATAGLNGLLANLLTKGTLSKEADEIATIIDSLGATLGASSGNNTITLSASCLMQDLETVLSIVGDCLRSPAFKGDAIEREKAIQINAIEEALMDPVTLAFRELRKLMYGEEGYGISGMGSIEGVKAIDRISIVSQHKAHFNASNMVVSVFGDIEAEHTEALLEKYFGKIPEGQEVNFDGVEVLSAQQKQLHLDKQQGVLVLGYPGLDVKDDDRYALGLIHAWCSDMAGPVFTKIREELGLAYYASSTTFFGMGTGFFGFYLGTSPEQLNLAKEELLKLIRTIAENGMNEDELERVKTSWIAKQSLTNQSNGAVAAVCSVDSLLGLGATHFEESRERIKKLSIMDIKRVAGRLFGETAPTIIEVFPEN